MEVLGDGDGVGEVPGGALATRRVCAVALVDRDALTPDLQLRL